MEGYVDVIIHTYMKQFIGYMTIGMGQYTDQPLLYQATMNHDDVDDAATSASTLLFCVVLLLCWLVGWLVRGWLYEFDWWVCTVSRTKLKANTYFQVFRIKPSARTFSCLLIRSYVRSWTF